MGLSPVPFTGIFTHPFMTRIQYTTPEIVPKCFVSAPSREGGSLEGLWIRQGESRLHTSLSVIAANLNPTAVIDGMRLGTRVWARITEQSCTSTEIIQRGVNRPIKLQSWEWLSLESSNKWKSTRWKNNGHVILSHENISQQIYWEWNMPKYH